jgi:hypothetical protein
MPVLVRYEELAGRSFRVFYDDDDPNRVLREEQVAPGEVEQGPKDGLMGAGFAEGALTRLLALRVRPGTANAGRAGLPWCHDAERVPHRRVSRRAGSRCTSLAHERGKRPSTMEPLRSHPQVRARAGDCSPGHGSD